jgi:two-component system, LytTR family, response regulator
VSVRAIVADDEPLGRRGVRARLARHPDVDIVAECANGREVVAAVRRLRPDLLFLDVQMPGLDGFGALAELAPEERPHVLFVTAHDRHAVRAFEVHALDYLLKPIDDERFDAAVRRALATLAADRDRELGRRLAALLAEQGVAARGAAADDRCFVVRAPGRVVRVRFDELERAEGAGDYVRLHAAGRSWLLRATLGDVERRLATAGFLRVHRSEIVRIDRVEELRSLPNGDWTLRLRDGTTVRGGRGYRAAYERLAGRG